MKFRSKKLILIIVTLILFGGFFFIRLDKNKKSLPGLDLKKAQTAEVKKGNLEKYLIFAGKIDAQNFAVLHFQTSGQLAWLGVKEGDRVNKWQAVASLDKESLKKTLQKEMNDYLTSRWNFEDTQDQYKETKERKLITEEIKRILDRQQFTLNNAALDYEIANLAVKYATLISPLDGIVTDIENSTAGVNVTTPNFSVTVIDPASVYFKSEVDEEDVTKISENQVSKIVLDSFPDEEFGSKIVTIDFVPIEGQTATIYKVKFSLETDNIGLKYRIGMNGEAKIKTAEVTDVLYLPVEAIYEVNGEKFVYIKKGKDTPEKRIIKTGLENDSYAEITDGLDENEIVIYSD